LSCSEAKGILKLAKFQNILKLVKMEPLKINIEVSLSEATLEVLKDIFGPQIRPAGHQIDLDMLVSDTKPKKTKKQAPQPAPEPQPQGEDPEGTGAEDIGDLPPDDAPAPKPTPTESDARNAVQAARKRGVPAAKVKEYMKDSFGISSSVECPAERRQELIDGLNKLAA
jgi:DNA replication initiation complex subunit (GINS family)